MTEHLYILSLANQTRLFLLSLGFGFSAAALYDVFRCIRAVFGNKRPAYIVTDILYLITLSFLNFLFFLAFNEGEIRAFALLGELFGLIIYFFSVGAAVYSFVNKTSAYVRHFLTKCLKAISAPFRKIFLSVKSKWKKHVKIKKKSKNNENTP